MQSFIVGLWFYVLDTWKGFFCQTGLMKLIQGEGTTYSGTTVDRLAMHSARNVEIASRQQKQQKELPNKAWHMADGI